MKLDNKSILIIILLGISIIFGCMWFFRGSNTKDELNLLKMENKTIQLERDSIRKVNDELKVEFDTYQKQINLSEDRSKKIESELSKVKSDLTTIQSLSKKQKDMETFLYFTVFSK